MVGAPTPPGMTESEWDTRCDLAALYRVLHQFGWTDLIYNHLSARVPNEPGAFLINHYGEMFDEVTASSLVKMGLDGAVIGGGGVNKAGLTIHGAVYRTRPDVACVMHTHTRAGVAVSGLRRGLRPISQDALEIWHELGYHEYDATSAPGEHEALARSCRTANAIVLHNHGLLALGASIPEAFTRMYYFEHACQAEVAIRALNEKPLPVAEAVVAEAGPRKLKQRSDGTFGSREWASVLRMLDRKGVVYRV